MSEARNICLLASAGTGKTYRLTNRFLRLLFEGVEPERILATTFTRKAAGEILDRVLERLVEACESEEKRTELAKALGLGALEGATCRDLLASTTRSLHAFQVRTIDSFFVHLVGLFALELELPPDWSLCDDRVDVRLRSEVLQEVLAQEEPERIVLLLRELAKGDVGRSVHVTLLEKIGKLRHVHLECADGAWELPAVPAAVDDEELAAALAAIEASPLPKKRDGEEDSRWAKSRMTLLGRARDGLWEKVVDSGLGSKFLEEEPKFYGLPFPEEMVEPMKVLLRRAGAEVLGRLRDNNRAAAELLEAFEGAFQRRKRAEGVFGFSDLPYALAPRTARALPLDEGEHDRWFRLDGRIDHLLLDEFQDTAPVQWRILEELAREIVADGEGGRSLFCVGDVKQSIYSFRQAEPRLLAGLTERLPGLEPDEMHASYRSSAVVLDTVDRIFGDLAASPVFEGEGHEPHRRAAARWGEAYTTHSAARDLPGAAFAVEARASEEDEAHKDAPLLERAVERVEHILAEAPDAQVGVLLRKNKAIPRLIHALRQRGVDVSGEGGNPLTDARSVLVHLSLLHFIDHPDDTAAVFHVATSPLAVFARLEPGMGSEDRQRRSNELRAELQRDGLAEFTRRVALEIEDDATWNAWDRARFAQLLDQAYAFEPLGEARTSAFVEHVRTQSVESPSSARVRVMTIHGSKGLEFDAVVLPELTGHLLGQRDGVLVDRPDPAGSIQRASVAPRKGLLPISEELRGLYELLTERMVEDAASVLYVAATRAKRRLDLILPALPEKEGKKSKKPRAPETHQLIRAALAGDGWSEADEHGVVWTHPASATGGGWAKGLKPDQAVAPQAEEQRLQLAESTRPRSLRRRSPSRSESSAPVSAADCLRPTRGAQVGTLVHACLEDLEWVEGFDPEGHRALQRAGASAGKAALNVLRKALAAEPVRELLTPATCGAPEGLELEVLREASFVQLIEDDDGQQELWTASIDRLVLGREAGEVRWASVVDYKTDRVDEHGLDGLVEHHGPQLRSYARLVAQRYGLAPERVESKLAFLSEGEVRSVPPESA